MIGRADFLTEVQARQRMNELSSQAVPYIFVIDFLKENSLVIPLAALHSDSIQYDFSGFTNAVQSKIENREVEFKKFPQSFEDFEKSFKLVMEEILYGNSFLLNLTCQTPIEINFSLGEIFQKSKARYKLLLQGSYVCFSPETFVRIKDKHIYSYPMKGTIDASIEDAENIILNDPKEKAEHYTIVDLIRNDLSMVSDKVRVTKFRYIDRLKTNFGEILQVSSEVEGTLRDGYTAHLGDIIFTLLPAGSISGAPKERTVQIIRSAETYDRGFYTGIAGIFDGENLDSTVLIRFIEEQDGKKYFKSGGGITFMSDARAEYEEMISKVYVPFS